MMNRKKSNLLIYYISFFFLWISFPVVNLIAQEGSGFDHIVISKTAEINNDKFPDSIVVRQDTISEFRPYSLEIYFGRRNGKSKLMLKTEKAIQPDFPYGRDNIVSGNGFEEIEIKDNSFLIKHVLLRGHFEHRYQYRNKQFELVEYNHVESDGRGKIFTENINFTTGIRRTKIFSYEEDRLLEENEVKIQFKSTPTLKEHNLLPDGFR